VDGGGALGFTPSNLGDALSKLDLSKLDDVDITSASDVIDSVTPSCAGRGAANGACVTTTFAQSNGATVALYVARSWKIEPTAVLEVRGGNPIIFVALETIDILGRLDASGTQNTTAAGGFSGQPAAAGAGPGGGGQGTNSGPAGPGVGGGGGSYCGLGGTGGNVSASQGAAGKSYGVATVVPLVGGSTGGGAELFPGAGGGAIQLVAGASISIGAGGAVSVNGGGGDNGGTPSGSQAAAGGGSGGALLLEAPTVTVAGVLAANGGGGGGEGGGGSAVGSDGLRSATPAPGGNAARDPAGAGAAGGSGSGGAVTAGTNGDNGSIDYSAGGGGGGAGYIRINTTSGAASVTGTLSPAIGACATQGTLTK
jgi:hypothetical protein